MLESGSKGEQGAFISGNLSSEDEICHPNLETQIGFWCTQLLYTLERGMDTLSTHA
jgi:hypothetical protein